MSIEISSINLRISSLPHWMDCSRRGAANAFRDLIEGAGYKLAERRQSISAAIGTGTHAGASHTLREKKEARETKLKEVIEVSIEKFKAEIVNGVEFDNTTANRNDAEKQIKTITTSYHEYIAPKVEPVEIEYLLTGKISNNGMIINLTGHPDVIESGTIRDLKTSRNVKGYPAQLGGYQILAEANIELTFDRLIIDWLPRVPVSKPYPGASTFVMPVKACVDEAKAVIWTIKEQVKSFIETPSPMKFPANPCSILCSEKYCPAWGTAWCEVSKL